MISTGILLAVQMVFTYAPFMNAWFGSAPLGWVEWGFALLNGVVIFLLVELIKAVQNRGGRGAPTSVQR
ncbi:cation transporting ATPase C-terminal domain-containing protein [Kocuria atrinae]|uniref:cation transporting ATPase C-terminal domain-containing protein n=1 Tax=Kocuria atrinae TaxID=592377 RepID=UPI0003068028|nr:cation transporting ATPase C-terminal domain-containing protein [Kocuria atrinae]